MGSIENKSIINAVICIVGVQVPTFASYYLAPELAFAVSTVVFHVGVLAGVMAVFWPLYGLGRELYADGAVDSSGGGLGG